MWGKTAILLAGVSALAGAAQAAGPDAAAAFGAREAVQDISLSPDGTFVAYVVPAQGRGSAVLVSDIANGGEPKVVMSVQDPGARISDCSWSAVERIVCTVSAAGDTGGQRLTFTRLVAVNRDGTQLKMISSRESQTALAVMQNGGTIIDWTGGKGDGWALITHAYVPEFSTGTRLAQMKQGLGVDRINTLTLARERVEQPRPTAVEYLADGAGNVRIMGTQGEASSGYARDTISYSYRRKGASNWDKLSDVTFAGVLENGFNPYAVDAASDAVYGFERINGTRALVRVALDGSSKREVLFSRPDVDAADLVQVGRQHRVVGVSYVTDRREVKLFDPVLQQTLSALGKALPKSPILNVVDASADENRLLIFAGSDIDPGQYYVFNRRTRELNAVLPVRPQLDGMTLSPVRAITYKAADGTSIPGYLTLPPGGSTKNLPAIVLPHGGPGARDEWGFDWLAQYFAHQGYAVLQPNFRGSTGYGDAWFQKNGFQSWRTAVGDVNDAGRYLLSSGIAAPGKLGVVGWSYGGYAALQSSVLDPDLFKAIVAIAPVTDLNMVREEARFFTNFPQVSAMIGQGAHVREGSPLQNVAQIKAPVLLIHGDKDDNVGVGESRAMASKLRGADKKVDYVEFAGLDHQLADTAARTELLTKSDAFLKAAFAGK